MESQFYDALRYLYLEMLKDDEVKKGLHDALSGKSENALAEKSSFFQTLKIGGDLSKEIKVRLEHIEDFLPQMETRLTAEIMRIHGGQSEAAKREFEQLKTDKQRADKELERLRTDIGVLTEEKQKIEMAITDSNKKYAPLQETLRIWESLNELDEKEKSYIGELCGSFELYACLSLGREFKKIGQLWQKLKDMTISADSKGVRIFVDYFEFCIRVANSVRATAEQYVFFKPDIGAEFDVERCIKTSSSKQIGTVRRVITQGVKSGSTIIYQAIVEIG